MPGEFEDYLIKKMLAEIITIGDELLIGQVTDTNSGWIATQLNLCGIKVKQITAVSDDKAHIKQSLEDSSKRADLILMTGGLGPTKDDITKHTLCEYFNTSLRFDEEVYAHVKYLFSRFGKEVSELNKKQAEVPANCKVIHNAVGTAPGMWFESSAIPNPQSLIPNPQSKVYVSMPGVPYEMKKMMEKEIIPRIKLHFKTPHIIHRTILTQGIGESYLSEIIKDWEDGLAPDIKLAYLPSPGMVRLRLSASGDDEQYLTALIAEKVNALNLLVPQYIYGYESETLEGIIGELLSEKGKTLSVAESCTGGMLAQKITSIAGSSAYFRGGIVAYSNDIKTKMLGVSENTLKEYGAVSEQTVREMAEGARKNLNTDYAISTSGIAGPTGGTPEKPVGTVWIAIAAPNITIAKKFLFGDNRERNIMVTANIALNMLRKVLVKE